MPPIPKEHGAWALLYGPFLLVVAASGRFEWRLLVLLAAVTGLFLAHEPLSKLVRSSRFPVSKERVLYWKGWLSLYLLTALFSGLFLVWYFRLWLLIPFGLATTLIFILHLVLVGRRKERGLWGELVGAAGLTSTAPATCYVLEQDWETTCWLLWLLTFLYFTSGIFYVKMRVSQSIKVREHRKRVSHSVAYHTCLCVGLLLLTWFGRIPHLLFFAYVPITIRSITGLFAREEKLNIRRIGYTELAHTVLFVALFVVFWRV
jgi:hypothetical protein